MGKEELLALDEAEEDARDHLDTVLQLIAELRQARSDVTRLRADVERLEQEQEHRDSTFTGLEAEVALLRQENQKIPVYKQRIKQYKADIEGYRKVIEELEEKAGGHSPEISHAASRPSKRAAASEERSASPQRSPSKTRGRPKQEWATHKGRTVAARSGESDAGHNHRAPDHPNDAAFRDRPRHTSREPSESGSDEDQMVLYNERRLASRSSSRGKRKRSRSPSYDSRPVRRRSVSGERGAPPWKRDISRASQPSRSVGVFGLNPNITQEDLRDVFEEFGKIRSIQIVNNRSGKCPFSFIEFEDLNDAIDAKAKMHETRILGTVVRTDFAIGKYRKDGY